MIGEALSTAAREVLVYLWLSALAQTPSPHTTSTEHFSDAFRIPAPTIQDYLPDIRGIDSELPTRTNQRR